MMESIFNFFNASTGYILIYLENQYFLPDLEVCIFFFTIFYFLFERMVKHFLKLPQLYEAFQNKYAFPV